MLILPTNSETLRYILVVAFSFIFLLLSYWLLSRNSNSKDGAKRRKGRGGDVPSGASPEETEEIYNKALKILDEARAKSLKILSESKSLDERVTEDMHTKLCEVSAKQTEVVKEVSKNLVQEYKRAMSAELDSFKDTLHEEVIEAQQKVDEKVKSEYEVVHRDLIDYKKERLYEIDVAIYKIIAQVVSDVLGKTFSVEEHEELILKALEDAKSTSKFEV